MSDKPTKQATDDNAQQKITSPHLLRRILPYGVVLGIGIIALFYSIPWISQSPSDRDFVTLKSQTEALTHRVNHLEASLKTATIAPETSDLEKRINALSEQLVTLQNQPKPEVTQSSDPSKTFEKDLAHLAENQKRIRALLLFWRLKAKVLSDAPYRAELTDFKSVTPEIENLSLLEKYADQGLQASQIEKAAHSGENKSISLWDKIKSMASSIIRVEKVDGAASPSTTPSQVRQTIEEFLKDIDSKLTQHLQTTSENPSPAPGDVL